MDLEKLIQQRDRIVAEADKLLKARGADPSALLRPIELQEAQAARVEERIASLETRRSELAAAIDAEIKELRKDLDARRRKIERDGKELAAMAGRAHPRATASDKAAAAKPRSVVGGAIKESASRKPKAKAKPAKRGTARKAGGRGRSSKGGGA